MHRRFAVLVAFLLTLCSCALTFAAQVTDVRWGVDRYNVLRFVVDCSEVPKYSVTLSGQNMLITIDAGLAQGAAGTHKINSAIAKSMTVAGDSAKTTVSVPLERALSPQEYKGFTLRADPITKRPARFVLDVLADKTSAPVATVLTAKAPVVTKAKQTAKESIGVKAEPKVTVPIAGRSGVKKTETKTPATTAKKKEPIRRKSDFRVGNGIKDKRITIDPGHGGVDPGAIGGGGTKEKDVTLAISKTLAELLQKKGAEVTMTRRTDKDVAHPNADDAEELQARVDVAEDKKADVFISVHINASSNQGVGGFSTYYYPKTEHDAALATAIQKRLSKHFKLDNLGIRQANFYVNKRSSMPSALLELGFISNAQEERLMKSRWYINKLARVIADGIEDYFE